MEDDENTRHSDMDFKNEEKSIYKPINPNNNTIGVGNGNVINNISKSKETSLENNINLLSSFKLFK